MVSLDSDILLNLPVEKKEEISITINPYKLVPQLSIKTEHAAYIVSTASVDPSSLIGWQVMLGEKGLHVVTGAEKQYKCLGFTLPGVGPNSFKVQKSPSDDPEWVRLKLKPNSKGYAVKVLRKTSLIESTEDITQSVSPEDAE